MSIFSFLSLSLMTAVFLESLMSWDTNRMIRMPGLFSLLHGIELLADANVESNSWIFINQFEVLALPSLFLLV